jgi:glycosyltransferase involved in cell wall biosynthesis
MFESNVAIAEAPVIPRHDPPSNLDTRPVVLHTRVVVGAGGGPDKTIINSPRFIADGYRVLCAFMHGADDSAFERLRERAAEVGAALVSIPERGPLDPRAIYRLLQICRRERVAIWHGHDYKSNLIGLLLRPFWPMRLVTTAHGWVQYTRRTPLYYAIDRQCLKRYERVICVSDDLHDECRALGIAPERCLFVQNGIDLNQYRRRTPRDQAKRRLDVPPERLVIGAIGRLSAEKGFDALVRAADRLMAKGLDIELLIAGVGDEQGRLAALIAELGRGERIRLLGFRSDTISLYEAMDVYALSSLREGLPNVLLEAMALEVPVLATRVAGVPKLITDGANGLLVEPGSVDLLAEALANLLGDAALRDRLGRAGRATVEAKYSFAVRMEKIRAIYDELLGRATSSGPVAEEHRA